MPAGRPSSEDRAYAAELGLPLKAGSRKIGNLGGARKLKALSPEARRLLLHPKSIQPRRWGLEARGMAVCKPYQANEKFELYVQGLLQERGLVK